MILLKTTRLTAKKSKSAAATERGNFHRNVVIACVAGYGDNRSCCPVFKYKSFLPTVLVGTVHTFCNYDQYFLMQLNSCLEYVLFSVLVFLNPETDWAWLEESPESAI